MKRFERIAIGLAAFLSIAVHAAVAWAVLNMPVGRPGGTLFAAREQPQTYRSEVTRAALEDLADLAAEPETIDPGDDAEADARQLRDLVQDADVGAWTDDPAAVERSMPQPDAARATEAPAVEPGPVRLDEARVIDATARALRQLDPTLALPEFVAAVDEVPTPAPSDQPIAPSQVVDVAGLRGLNRDGDTPGGGDDGGDTAAAARPPRTVPGNDAPRRQPADEPAGATAGELAFDADIPLPEATTGLGLPGAPMRGLEVERLDNDFQYALMTFDGPLREPSRFLFFGSEDKPRPAEPGWFEVQVRPRSTLRRLEPLAKDVVYVLDTSGSIEEKWLGPVRHGVAAALDSLNDGDRFNVVRFDETVEVLDPGGLLEADDRNVERARQFIRKAAVAGYTDVNQALARLVRLPRDADRVYQVVFVSDGHPTAGAVDPKQIIDVFTRANNLVASVYAVSVGDKPDNQFLQALAYRNKGYVRRPERWVTATDAIADLASRLRYPILRDASFNAAGVDTSQLFPRQPRDVYKDDPIALFGRFDADDKRLVMEIRGGGATGPMAFAFELPFNRAAAGSRQIATQWAKARLHHLYGELLRSGQTRRPAVRQQIDDLREKYGLDD